MINVITPSVFVRHYGSISFGDSSSYYSSKNSIILNKKHPRYFKDIKKWVREDPLNAFRIKIDLLRVKNHKKTNQKNTISIVSKNSDENCLMKLDTEITIVLSDNEFNIICNGIFNTPNLRKIKTIKLDECIREIGAGQAYIYHLNKFSRRQLIQLTILLKFNLQLILVLDRESKEFIKRVNFYTDSPLGKFYTLINKYLGFSSRYYLCNAIISRALTRVM